MQYITGASGFLGSHLLKRLGDATAIPHDEIGSFQLKPFSNFFFCSAYGNLSSHKQDLNVFTANVIDPLAVIQQAVKFDFNSFVFISTSSVKLRTQTAYSRSKKAAEEILFAFMEKYNKPICIIRPLSITGVGEQKEHLIPTLIDAAFTGKQVNLVPDATHDFIDVEDVVNGILSLSEHRAKGVFELGTGVKHSNLQVLRLVEKVTGKKVNVNFIDGLRPYDNEDWVSTNFKARGFGWLPMKSLEQSITEMVKAYETLK